MVRSCLFGALLLALAAPVAAEVRVRTDFPGGSAQVVHLDARRGELHLRPNGDSRRGWPCWWFFQIEGLTAGQTLQVTVLPSEAAQLQPGTGQGKPLAAAWAQPERPTVSDDGQTWRPGEVGARTEGRSSSRRSASRRFST